jgi:hypothetical protein
MNTSFKRPELVVQGPIQEFITEEEKQEFITTLSSALWRFVYHGEENVADIQELLAVGPDVNRKCRYDYTPLHSAACMGYTDTVQVLLAAGADVNSKDNDGRTPLQVATNQAIVNILKKAALEQKELRSRCVIL